ncbi:hypothetical protein B0H34DRAFT_536332 [Crassisporium funariophilum]|nr:hypothetical protein B0H34DRAFT_536332 [Crassisporium funariophilum]
MMKIWESHAECHHHEGGGPASASLLQSGGPASASLLQSGGPASASLLQSGDPASASLLQSGDDAAASAFRFRDGTVALFHDGGPASASRLHDGGPASHRVSMMVGQLRLRATGSQRGSAQCSTVNSMVNDALQPPRSFQRSSHHSEKHTTG